MTRSDDVRVNGTVYVAADGYPDGDYIPFLAAEDLPPAPAETLGRRAPTAS